MRVSSIVWFANLDSIISIFMKILRCFKVNQVLVNGVDVFRCCLIAFDQFFFKTKKTHLEVNCRRTEFVVWEGRTTGSSWDLIHSYRFIFLSLK